MKVMTWNIRLGIQKGLDAIIEEIRIHNPDILALQEVGRHWKMGPLGDTTTTIASALEYFGSFAPCIVEDQHEYGHALLSRWPIEEAEVIQLPQDVDEPRALLYTEVAHPEFKLKVLSTHLSYIDDRALQAPVLLNSVRDRRPHLVLGDLNADGEPWLLEMDGLLNRAEQPLATYPTPDPRLNLDYLFSTGTWKEAQRLDTGESSDHYAVLGVLALPTSS